MSRATNVGNTSIGWVAVERILPNGVTVDDVRALVALLVETKGGECWARYSTSTCHKYRHGDSPHRGTGWQWQDSNNLAIPSPWTPRMVELLETLGGTR